MRANFKKSTAIAAYCGALLWGATCVLVSQNALAQVVIRNGSFIRNQESNRCLDVEGEPGVAPGTPLILADCELSGFSPSGALTDQKWEFIGGGFIRNIVSNRCLDVEGEPGVAPGTRLILADCELSGFSPSGALTDQKWEFIGGGFIRNIVSNRCLDVEGEPGIAPGTPLILADCELSGFSPSGDRTDQIWSWVSSF